MDTKERIIFDMFGNFIIISCTHTYTNRQTRDTFLKKEKFSVKLSPGKNVEIYISQNVKQTNQKKCCLKNVSSRVSEREKTKHTKRQNWNQMSISLPWIFQKKLSIWLLNHHHHQSLSKFIYFTLVVMMLREAKMWG